MSGGKLEVQIGADKTDFDKKIKEVEYDIKELSKIKLEQIKLGIDTKEINAQIKDAKANLNSLKTTVKDTGQTFAGMAPKVANGGNALMQFSRIAQDAPYGIIGIGNNITATVEAFGHLKQSTGSTGGALKALGSSIVGSGGILLGVSLLTTGLTYLAQSGLTVGDIFDKISGNFDEFGNNLRKANEEAAKTAGTEIANMKALVSVAQDETQSRKDRLTAVKELQKEFPAYFGNLSQEKILNGDLTAVTKELTLAIVARAKASAYAGEIGKLASEELQLNNKINKELDSMIKNYNLTAAEAKKFNEQVAKGADAFKLLEPFKKRAGFFDVASAVKSSAAIAGIRVELIENQRQQKLYTEAINESTKASIKLREEVAKPAKKIFDTPQVKGIPRLIVPAPLFDTNSIATFNGQVDQFGNKIRELPGVFQTTFANIQNTLSVETARMGAALIKFNGLANEIINDSIAQTFAGLGSAIGTALATGADVLGSVGASLLSSLGALLVDMGKMALTIGVSLLAIKVGLESLNPAVVIGAGVALIALGSFFSSKSSSLGGRVGGGGGASSSSGAGANNSSFTSGGFSSNSGGGTVVFEIAGQKLIGVLSNTINANKRLGGTIGL